MYTVQNLKKFGNVVNTTLDTGYVDVKSSLKLVSVYKCCRFVELRRVRVLNIMKKMVNNTLALAPEI
jgi:hypothetical protein